MVVGSGVVVWDVLFARLVNDWEMDVCSEFYSLLYSWSRRSGNEDKLLWRGYPNGVFSVKSLYVLLLEGSYADFPWRLCWKNRVPPRVAFFVWEATQGKILTIDNLRRRGVYVTEWCYLCKSAGETVDHILLHCSMARGVWGNVLSILNYDWVMPRRVVDVLRCWRRKFEDLNALVIWKMIPACIWWCLWRERNGRCFEDRVESLVRLGGFVLHSLFLWANSVLGCPFVGFPDFISFLACML
jgi:mannosylglycoprotein endo-beta-mannosidase